MLNTQPPGCVAPVPRSGSPTSKLSPQPPVGKQPTACSCPRQPSPICLRLLLHCIRRAASRAACTAGSNSAIKMPMIVMTTKSSTKVKPCRGRRKLNFR